MTKNIISKVLAGVAMASFAVALVFSAPSSAQAGYNGGYNNNYGYNTNYGYNNNYNYGNNYNCGCNNYGYNYPSGPTYYNTPSVQVTYPNGYYQNYFVPTVRYYPAYNNYNNNYGGYRNW